MPRLPKTVRVNRRDWVRIIKRLRSCEERVVKLEHEARQVDSIRQKDARIVSYLKAVLVLLKQR